MALSVKNDKTFSAKIKENVKEYITTCLEVPKNCGATKIEILPFVTVCGRASIRFYKFFKYICSANKDA